MLAGTAQVHTVMAAFMLGWAAHGARASARLQVTSLCAAGLQAAALETAVGSPSIC